MSDDLRILRRALDMANARAERWKRRTTDARADLAVAEERIFDLEAELRYREMAVDAPARRREAAQDDAGAGVAESDGGEKREPQIADCGRPHPGGCAWIRGGPDDRICLQPEGRP